MKTLKKSIRNRTLRNVVASTGGVLLTVTVVLGGIYASYVLRRPARSPEVRSLFQGIEYERYVRDKPRPLMFHVIKIDLTAPGIGFLSTPQGPDAGGNETVADTVPGFLEKHDVQVAINANFFYPMHVRHPLDYSPKVGEGVNVVGLAISEGNRYSAVEPDWPALCIVSPQDISIADGGDCPANTMQAWTGDRTFLKNGQLVPDTNHNQLFPRTVVALDRDHTTMWLVTVDGRQKGYSEGVTLAEMADELIALGADEALNLDGGGSSALAVNDNGTAKLMNAPIQARLPMYLRPVANHLGVYANELPSELSDATASETIGETSEETID